MPLSSPLPDWIPWWGQLVVLVLAILFGFAFLMMPFAVFGLKGRLDFLEAQLDDIHAELRMLASRLPDPDRPAAAREPVVEQLAPRAGPQRAPSPTQRPAAVEPDRPSRDQGPFQPQHEPPPATRPVFGSRPVPRQPAPPRFVAATPPEPRRPLPPPDRAPVHPEDGSGGWSAGDWSPGDQSPGDWSAADDAAPRRPLRATTLRDPGRMPARRDDPPDRGRSEPTLRWPPG